MEADRKKKGLRKGTALLCALSVLISGCFSGYGLFSHAAGETYDYYVRVSASGDDMTAEVNSDKAFCDIQLAYDALLCRWAAGGGDRQAELGIILDTDITVESAFMMGIGERYGRAHDGTDTDAQTGQYQRLEVDTKKLSDITYNDYTLTLDGQGHTISPDPDSMWSTFSPYAITNDRYRSSVMMAANGGSITLKNVVFDGQEKDVTGVFLYNNTYHENTGVKELNVTGCTFRDFCPQQSTQYGGGLGTATFGSSHGVACEISVEGCLFENNHSNTGAVTYGGALYAGRDVRCVVRDSSFTGNSANTGGAAAVYSGLLDIDGSCTFSGNEASQRGGTIHDAGTVILKDMDSSSFKGGHCGQFGGAVTVASNPDFTGRLVLDHCSIQGFTAGNAGGGIYVYSGSEVYLYGGSGVTGNFNQENINNEQVSYASNIHAASSSAKLYAGGVTGQTGISTSNPAERKVLVYSAGEEAVSELNEEIRRLGGTQSYGTCSMDESFSEEDFGRITYDSEVYRLVQDREMPDNMWLEISAGSYIFWDLNIPGIASPEAVQGTAGGTEEAPEVSAELTSQNMVYQFKGWYTEAAGGEKITSGVYPQNGVQVYYAQWELKENSVSPPETESSYFTVFFDRNYDGGGITGELVGDTVLTVTVTRADGTEQILEYHLMPLGFSFPDDPVREGYDFEGWSLTSDNSSGVVETAYRPSESVTLFAVWKARRHTLTWNAGEEAVRTTQQDYGSAVEVPEAPEREGYEFAGWFLDEECTVALTGGERVYEDTVYYAKWSAGSCLISWDAGYTGGAVTAVRQDYGEALLIQQKPERSGYEFAGWYTGRDGSGIRAENYGTVKENVTFYACWSHGTTDYDVEIRWDDFSDNDGMRPENITVVLLRNGVETGEVCTLTEADASAEDSNIWEYTFEDLPLSDDVSSRYVYSAAVKGSISDEYEYDADFSSAAYAGYIHMTHSLVLTDLPVYIAWNDDRDNDGYRPSSVRVKLTADGETAAEADFFYREGRYQPAEVSLAGEGETWQYLFRGFQKYRQNGTQKGQEIQYGIIVEEITRGDLDVYDIEYSGCTAILSHGTDMLSKAVTVEWDDSNNQDNRRPANIVVQLYADKAAVANRYVTLSDANGWTYIWNGLPKYTDEGTLIHYEAGVVSTLTDYTASCAGMVVRLTYVPENTSISAGITWADEENADGIRPDYLLAELIADGEPTGDIQTISAEGNWSVTWKNYPYYAGGKRIEYTFRIEEPEGYQVSYYGKYDSSGLSAVLTREKVRRDITVTVVWKDGSGPDRMNPDSLTLQLYDDARKEGEYVYRGDFTKEAEYEVQGSLVWTFRFCDLPVLSQDDPDREVKYLYYIEQEEMKKLEKAGFTADYNGYETDSNVYSGNDETCFLYLSEDGETAVQENGDAGEDKENISQGSGPGGGSAQKPADQDEQKDAEKTGDEESGQNTQIASEKEQSSADLSEWFDTETKDAYMHGYPDGSFRADGLMTRAEAAQMFFNLLKDHGSSVSVRFRDVSEDCWYADAAGRLAELGIINGYPDGTFCGGRTITRAEFAAMAARFAGAESAENVSCSYSDVLKGGWASKAIASATAYGWLQGYPDGTFRPEDDITRAEVCTAVNRMLGRSAGTAPVRENSEEMSSFYDLSETHWAYFEIAEAVCAYNFSDTGR